LYVIHRKVSGAGGVLSTTEPQRNLNTVLYLCPLW
jgi:hypothetical protein